MERVNRFRARLLLVFFIVIIGLFAFSLYDTQIIQTGGKPADNTTVFITETHVKAARGDILDSNGNVLVSNRASYDLVLISNVLLYAKGTNQYLYDLVETCDRLGVKYNCHFPVSAPPFTYTLDKQSTIWRGYFQKYLADYNLDSDITAPLLMEKLRSRYSIPKEWSDEQAWKVIGIRYEMSLRTVVYSLPNYVFLSDASDEALSAIVELNVPGLRVEPSTVREYNTTYAAHILGAVGAMSPEQWEYYKTVPGYNMDSQIGLSGLEGAYEEFLHGVDGVRVDTFAVDGTLISSKYTTEPQAGSNVEVSIDINMQMAAETKLASVIEKLRAQEKEDADGKDAEGGAVVAIDVKTGQVLVCASYPTYNPAEYFTKYNDLVKADYNPLYNRALLNAYPPGSTYKMASIITAMEYSNLSPTTVIYDKGLYDRYEDFKVSCLQWSASGGRYTHREVTAAKALKVSCNYFFYVLSETMKIADLDHVAKTLGLGEPTGIELYESIGYRANPETKKWLYTDPDYQTWVTGDMLTCVIGQSDNRFTPIQLCVYAAAIANRGVRNKATFMNRVVSSDYTTLLAENKPQVVDRLEMSTTTYSTVKQGMWQVANESGGTAYSVFRNFPITIGAKTGTAEQFWGQSDNGAFVCFAPFDDPQIAIAVYVEKGGHGSTVASVAKDILSVYFDVDDVSDVVVYENKIN